MKRKYNYDFNNDIMAIHAKIVNEIVDIFKEHDTTRIQLDDGEDGYNMFRMTMYNEWDDYTITEHITSISVEVDDTTDFICVEIKLYCEEGGFYFLDECTDGNAILSVYNRVYEHFYSVKE